MKAQIPKRDLDSKYTLIVRMFVNFLFLYIFVLLAQQFGFIKEPFIGRLLLLLVLALAGLMIWRRRSAENTPIPQAGAGRIWMMIPLILVGYLVILKTEELGRYEGWILGISSLTLLALLLYEEDTQNELLDIALLPNTWLPAILAIFGAASLLGLLADWGTLWALLGAFYLFFLGGFVWSYALFSVGEIHAFERVTIGSLLSLLGIPLLFFYLSRIGLQITALNVGLVNLGVIVFGVLAYKYKDFLTNTFNRVFRPKP